MRRIDHIVYAVPNLHEAVETFNARLGVTAHIGGRHLNRGTHNALVNLGKGAYLELIAVDHDNHNFVGNRWMGIDLLDKARVVRWSMRSEDINRDARWLRMKAPNLSTIVEGSRLTTDGDELAWKMTLPGSSPMVEIIPFFTDWSESSFHPCDRLVEEVELLSISITGSRVRDLEFFQADLNFPLKLVEAQEARIRIEIKTPSGVFTL